MKYTAAWFASSADIRGIAVIPEYIELCPDCLKGLIAEDRSCHSCGYHGQDSIYYARMMGRIPD